MYRSWTFLLCSGLFGCSGLAAGNVEDASPPRDASEIAEPSSDVGVLDAAEAQDVAADLGQDVPPADVPEMWCGPRVDPTLGAMPMLYVSALIEPLGLENNSETLLLETAATLLPRRRLSEAIRIRCPLNEFMQTPSECVIGHSFVFRLANNRLLEFLLSQPESPSLYLSNIPVTLRLDRPSFAAGTRLVVRDTADRILFATIADENREDDQWELGPLRFRRVADAPICVSGIEAMCQRQVAAYALEVSPASTSETFAPVILAPAAQTIVVTTQGRYAVWHRKTLRPLSSTCQPETRRASHFDIARLLN